MNQLSMFTANPHAQVENQVSTAEKPVHVLYIGGYSRSGSTLLSTLLNEIEGVAAVGELWDIWERSFIQNQLTGRGEPFRESSFWQSVVEEAYGNFSELDPQGVHALRGAVRDNQHLPMLLFPHLRTPAYKARLHEYTEILGRLFTGIQRVSGSAVIVDSSKVPTHAALLSNVRNLNLSILHLVRDSRAVAYSWQRKKKRPEIHWTTQYMNRYSPFRSAMEWDVMNGLFHAIPFRDAQYMRIRYEDLVRQPQSTLQAVVNNFYDFPLSVPSTINHSFEPKPNWMVSGNPDRFKQGPIDIRPDEEWQEKMSTRQRRLVTLLTRPLLNRYGYSK